MLAGPDNTSWGHRQYFVPTTWNPADKAAGITLSNGDLTVSSSTGDQGVRGVYGLDIDAGESAYAEFTLDTIGSAAIGIALATAPISGANPQGHADSWVLNFGSGFWENTGGDDTASGFSFSPGDIMQIALKGTKLWWGRNGVWANSGDPAAGTNAAYGTLSGVFYPIYIQSGGTAAAATGNFGQSAFTYTPPAGFTPGWGVVS